MPSSPTPTPRSASPVWLLAAGATLAGAIALAVVALVHQRDASRPIGEGALFQREAVLAGSGFDPTADPGREVRRIRNDLAIEAVGLLGADGSYRAATSESLVGVAETDPFLRDLATSGSFGAIAGPAPVALAIDGVPEWPAGAILYRVLQPLPGGDSLVLHYDISQLLARRAGSRGIQTLTVQAGAGAAVLLLLTVALWSARSAAVRRIRQHQAETVRLAERAVELERLNLQLDAARREAERALDLAEETNRIRSDFVMMINHELRTPLTSLITGTELLRQGPIEHPDRDHLLADMSRDGKRLMGLIANILAVARIENRGLDYRLRATPVAGLLETVRAMTSAAEISPADEAAEVLTDPDGLVHLLVSLAENARTHGARRVTIGVGAPPPRPADHVVGSPPAEAVFFSVTDDGPGIDAEFLPRAFEKFEKSSFSSGTGLGLYVARLMVEAIEGAILVHSGPEGTVMTVAVPRRTGARVAA